MPTPVYVQRVARLPEVLRVLSSYADGLTLTELAAQFSVGEKVLREDLMTYLDLDSWGWGHDLFRLPVVEFVSADGAGDDDSGDDDSATVVRVVRDGTLGLGVEHVDAAELAVAYTAGLALLDVEPDNEHLAAALAVVAETMLGEPADAPAPSGDVPVATLQRACEERRRVRIVYSRSWHEGVGERVIEPLRVVQTRRGWEVDAGPVASDGNLRTFLLDHVREAEVLDETFEPPDDLAGRLARQRASTTVRLELAQHARWAADQYAERVTVVDEDELSFTADLELLAPVGRRIGLMMLTSGTGTRLLTDGATLLPDALGFVRELIEHHEAT